jgi:hypothetical protein
MPLYPESVARCQQIKVNGTQCSSPALRSQKFCYFHKQYREKRLQINAIRSACGAVPLEPQPGRPSKAASTTNWRRKMRKKKTRRKKRRQKKIGRR